MKKLLSRSLVVALVLVMALTMVASGASTTKNLSTGFTVVNLGPAQATVNIDYVKEDGTPWTGSSTTSLLLAANGGQAQVKQYFDTLTSGKGSVVLSSNQPLGAVVQVLARAPQIATNGAYSGFTTGSSKFFLPLVQRRKSTASGLGNSQIMVQNTTSADVAVNIMFYAGSATAVFTKGPVTIHPGATYYYDIEGEAGIAAGFSGSAVVDAGTGKVAVVSNLFFGAHGLNTFNGFPEENVGPKWAVPQFNSNLSNGLQTPVNVQNLSGSPIAAGGITLSCTHATTPALNFSKTNPAEIAANAAYSFNPVVGAPSAYPVSWEGSCTVDAVAANIVALVQLRYPGRSDETAAYEAFNVTTTDHKVIAPLMSMHLTNGFCTVASIQNISDQVAHVKVTFKRADGNVIGNAQYVFDNVVINAGGMISYNFKTDNQGTAIPWGWEGSMTVEDGSDGTAARVLVGFVQLRNYKVPPGDTYMAHNAFTQP